MTIDTSVLNKQARPILILLGKETFVGGDLKMHKGVSIQILNKQPKI